MARRFDHLEQVLVRVMPGVPANIMRRGGQAPVGQAMPPIQLAFQIGAVARRTVLVVDNFAASDEARAVRIRLGRLLTCDRRAKQSEESRYARGTRSNRPASC
jgi:hypothetical protein